MMRIHFYTLVLILIVYPAFTIAQQVRLKLENQVSAWSTVGFDDPVNYQFGARYIPTLSLSDSLKKSRIIDAEVSANAFGNAFFSGREYDDGEAVLKPYRLWIRYATPRLEFRIGLQKISFGSASILRPLMWFDKMDFRDPLQLTDGVYSFLGRYYFQSNENIWFWVLYGNDKTKGWEAFPTQKHTPEFGGRFQLPHERGEAAFSFHHRKADFKFSNDSLPIQIEEQYPEDRFGFDGKWDIGVGLSFEGVIKHNYADNPMIPEWETYLNLGIDYTIPLGNGLGLTGEYFRTSVNEELNKAGQHSTYTALAVNYPLGILNSFSVMVYYNWDQKEWYRIISLQRKYDYWSFYLMAFWNPSEFSLYNATQDRNLFAGKGIQLMAVVNF